MTTPHILIIRFSAMGDVAMVVPVVYSLAKQYPQVHFTMLSRPFARPLFEHIAPNVSFMGADMKHEYHGIKGLNALFRRLAAKNFTAVADLHNVLRSTYLRMRFNLGNYRVEHLVKDRQQRMLLTRSHDKVLQQLPSAFDNYAQVFSRLGYPIDFSFKTLLSPAQANLRLLPAAIGEKKAFQKWIGIAPFAAHKGKSYPLPHMKEVIAQITHRHPSCRIFLFGGGADENALLDTLVARDSHCVSVPRYLNDLHHELILMSHLDVMISMDSANMHLASLVAVPVVSVWGATHPYAGFMGWNQSPDDAVQVDLPCRPCSVYGKKECARGDYACLHQIDPEVIVNKVERHLN
jgi:ADP-heptose:LPS heptosyltransferase